MNPIDIYIAFAFGLTVGIGGMGGYMRNRYTDSIIVLHEALLDEQDHSAALQQELHDASTTKVERRTGSRARKAL